jgi:radical S-adenosyl methionine domain-containing protein 2
MMFHVFQLSFGNLDQISFFSVTTLLCVALNKMKNNNYLKKDQKKLIKTTLKDHEKPPQEEQEHQKIVAVNYHFTRQCNFACGFCFHTAKTSHVESLENAFRIIRELREAGAEKINFAGGEPFLPNYKNMLGEMVKYAKMDCGYQSVSIISNGHFIKQTFFENYANYLDILGVSCDSQYDEVNKKIGRGKGGQADQVIKVATWCKEYGVKFKLNTVVNAYNKDEDMTSFVSRVNPMRWKVFQVLKLEGENSGEGAKRNISDFLISDNEFQKFVALHSSNEFIRSSNIMKVEDNSAMKSSYILVDEYGRFLDSSTGGKVPTQSMLEVGVAKAFEQLISSDGGGYDNVAFYDRDGDYNGQTEWSKNSPSSCDSCGGASSSSGRDVMDMEDMCI